MLNTMKWIAFSIGVTMLAGIIAGTAKAQTLCINVYNQRDARWSNDTMGASGLKVGNYGCMMTCLAAAYRVTPGTLNSYLSKSGGYTSSGALIHSVAANYDGPGGLRYVGVGSLPKNAAGVGQGIGSRLVYVTQSNRYQNQTHWVLVYCVSGGQAYYADSSDGTIRRVGAAESGGRIWVSYGASTRVYSW